MRAESNRWPEPAWTLAAVVALMAAPKAVRFWAGDAIFSLGFILVPWAAWRVATAERGEPAAFGWRAVALGVTLLLAGAGWFFGSLPAAVWAVAAALATLALERGVGRRAVLPVGLVLLTVPPPGFEHVLVGAQHAVAVVSGGVLAGIGLPVAREAWFLSTENYTFIVEPVCTGLSGLLATTALVGMVGSHQVSPWRRVLAAAAVGAGVALTLNVLRIVLLVAVTEWWGPSLIEGAFHGGVSLVLSLVAFACTLPILSRGEKGVLGV